MNSRGTFIAKILVPRRRPNTVARARLIDALRGGSNGTLTVIRAPAGFGKTTLLVDLVNEAPAATCWVSLDEWDRDAVTFLQYLRLAIRRLESPHGTRDPLGFSDEPRALLSEIAERIALHSEDIWIVLDDFHHLDGCEQVLELIDYLARRMPPNCRLLLATRTHPALPSLARLRLSGDVTELGPSDLAFTADEIKQFYDLNRERPVSDDEVSRISALTEGWPAGVALMGDPAGLGEARRETPLELSDYLASEVFERLPQDLRRFLLWTSVFDNLEAEGCDAVLQEEGARRHLESIEKHNVPVFRVEGAAAEHRVHPLFRDFLRASLRSEDPGLWAELNRRAGAWQASRGRFNEGIWHFVQGEDWEQAATLIEQEAPLAYKRGRWHMVTSWLELLPPSERQSRLRLRLWEARILVRLGQASRALQLIGEIIDVTPSSAAVLLAELETLRATALRVKGDVRSALESCQRAVDMATQGNAPMDVVAEAQKQLGQALFSAGAFAEAAQELRAVLDIYERRGDIEEAAFVNGCLGSVLGSLGRLEESATHLEHARQQWKKVGNAKEMSWVLNNLAMTYLQMGQRDLAYELLLESLAKTRQGGHERAEAYALVSLADIEQQWNDLPSARRRYEEALALSGDLGEMTLATHAMTGLALTCLYEGDRGKADVLALRALVSAEQRGSDYEQGLAHAVRGRIFRQQGRLEEAISALQSATALFERSGASRELAAALLHLADAALPIRSRRALLRLTLERLAAIGRESSVGHFLAYAGQEAPGVLQYAASRKVGNGFFRELLRKAAASEAVRGAPDDERRAIFPVVEARALGNLEVRMDGRTILSIEWESEKSKELFLLLLTTDRPLTRDEIVANLWPDRGGKKASSAFHSTLHRMRGALYQECVTESGGTYALQPSGTFLYDVRDFLHSSEKARRLGEAHPGYADAMREAVNLYRGPFVALLDGEWAQSYRLKLEERFVGVAARLGAHLLQKGDYAGTIEVSNALLNSDPYNETAVQQLMQALAALGDREGAFRVYRRYCDVLEQELGLKPGRDIEQLHSEIRNGAKGTLLKPP